jgi:hypothetical protein
MAAPVASASSSGVQPEKTSAEERTPIAPKYLSFLLIILILRILIIFL